ncbi:hypothetical protein BAUCODRAFT_498260 [Baudoinia panamericana UAMH 10762]|uniref:RNA ligase/cyclic nucleotide phosphodiesterase n=1 Tax=Baudoinia panamericana (strain UAMH 10762) TaxID=717646 RepID=M2MVR0_BAUPA|nr:uncharacterized protein BAUCODRAFT_498260 [Baudoinia panamericana UAMH 10762]EMC95653.1 hypothetical protein BAUCODRAFT_498260 [Baudoinia panamericana UAMH 10762]
MMAAFYTFEDLSGGQTSSSSDNPYDGLLEACGHDPKQIQARYELHRTNRNAQQGAKLLAPEFPGVTVDEILAKLENPSIEPGFTDWRHCLVSWARPPQHVRSLIAGIQQRLLTVAPNTWTMPQPNLHMTALEITHSLGANEIDDLVEQMLPSVPAFTDYTFEHRARLVKPMLSFDAQALALSFLPAAGEFGRDARADAYTYHHLRRDLYAKASATGVKVASRYVIPSAHLTIARFVTKSDFEAADGKVDHAKVQELLGVIESINSWLHAEYWPSEDGSDDAFAWIVGEEKGLDYRKGALWYGGGGETVHLGRGF